ncbi:hypothetical protein HDU88_007589 [Geranomyces variabilis]|nr:hypothetical protein HDU88_007589 [Geranomyces variabilis]
MRSSIAVLAAVALPLAAAQGSWNRRVYFTDTTCAGSIGYQESVFAPTTACPAGSTGAIANCEVKSTAKVASGEETGCDAVPTNAAVSVDPYFPAAGAAKIAKANYLTVNAYNAATCGKGTGNVAITQLTFAADGACHVMEPGNYFKASCNSAGAIVQWCDDADCTACPGAKVMSFRSDCSSGDYQGQPAQSICTLAAGNVDQPLPVVNGTTSVIVPLPASSTVAAASSTAASASAPTAATAAASKTAGGASAATTPSSTAAASDKSSGAALESAAGVVGALLSGLAAAVAI